VSVLTDPREVHDRFFDLVLSDPDLLDIEFAAVLASWDRPPAAAPPKIARRADWGHRRRRAPRDVDAELPASPLVADWQLSSARSPP
jgi:hypothetical protein